MRGLTRRAALGALAGSAAGAAGLAGRRAQAQALRGGLFEATDSRLVPGAPDDQSDALTRALVDAAGSGRPLFLPPGRYRIAQVPLPERAHIVGVPGETRLVFGGGPFMLRARHATRLRLDGITLDGDALPLDPAVPALLDAGDVDDVAIDDCTVTASGAAGVTISNSAGRVERSRFDTIGTVGIDIAEARGMAVTGNVVDGVGNTGILVRRDAESEDGTLVTGNRVTNVRADAGGTGQNGNGINLDKANGVVVANNRVDSCAFSAIRCFSSDDVSVTGNVCTRLGEMALYVEFAFEGAVVANNLIDGAVNGIAFANFMQYGGRLGTCTGNVVRNISGGPRYADGNPQIGAGIAAEADVAITGNTIESVEWGLQLGWGPYLRDVTASGNVIRKAKIGIAVSVVEGGGPAIVSGNLIDETERGAILGTRWEDVATEELVNGDGGAPDWLTLTGNRAR